ncbi:hypothetical protein VTN77DRAFT_9815 [Rasamsonia byssochlamydoides]|uniref:uncharacterized protein n=1 Tax=Rasamsonia byssochlamydoides TaxID=89139 RepID=UPI003742656E
MNSPPVPSTLPPADRAQRRFYPLRTPTEWIEDYRPGKYHPVHLGDTFKNARYKVIRKLGYGSFSTVWLAKDEELHSYVAIKILAASETCTPDEVVILNTLSQSTLQHPGKQRLVELLDSFEHQGPNGTHLCLVFEVMGPSVATIADRLPANILLSGTGQQSSFPMWMAKSILRQVLLGIDFLHLNNIAHGDLQPGNLLFSVRDLSSATEEELSQIQKENTLSEPVRKLDGKVDLWAPRYLALNQPLTDYVDFGPKFVIKISDIGGGFFISDPPATSVIPLGFRSPELIFEKKVSEDQDIWSFGCLMFEIITGTPLFAVGSSGEDDAETADDDLFLQLYDVIGPSPASMLAQWPRSRIYCNVNGERIKNYVGNLPEDDYFDPDEMIQPLPPLEEYFDQVKPADCSDEDADVVKALLRRILQYDPTKRPSTSELLQHPWFVDCLSESTEYIKE